MSRDIKFSGGVPIWPSVRRIQRRTFSTGGQRWEESIKSGRGDSMSLENAVKSNDKRASLIALRDKIAETIETTDSGRDIAALSKRLMEVMDEIDATPDISKANNSPMGRRRAKNNA